MLKNGRVLRDARPNFGDCLGAVHCRSGSQEDIDFLEKTTRRLLVFEE